MGVSFDFEPENSNSGFKFREVSEKCVGKLIDRIKSKVATGYDGIPSRVIKDLKQEASADLARLVNLSYNTAVFPDKLKHALIKAIYKNKGNQNAPEFYRPISVLSVISKIFERSATDQIVEYLETTSKFFNNQHAYRRKHSTTTCLVEATDYIHSKLDSGQMVGLISTDLSKAFDTLSHNHPLSKLQNLGFSTSAVAWVKSYLSNRSQQVNMNGIISSSQTVESGVPQGSILGPVLFIAFTSDFHECFPDFKITAFADDTQIMVTGQSSEEIRTKAETAIATAQEWFTANSLKINPSKSEVMIFGGRRLTGQVSISVQEGSETKEIKTTNSMKILGVIVDDKLTYEKHINRIKQRTHRTISNLARTSHVLPLKSRRTLYDALVAPHFNYCDVVWHGISAAQSRSLQKTANFAARALLGEKKNTSATQALRKMNMVPLSLKRDIHMGVFVHKLTNSNGPKETVQRYNDRIKRNHDHHTRAAAKADMTIITHNTSKFKTSTQFRALKCWNTIPTALRSISDASTFKKQYQRFLVNNYQNDNECLLSQ